MSRWYRRDGDNHNHKHFDYSDDGLGETVTGLKTIMMSSKLTIVAKRLLGKVLNEFVKEPVDKHDCEHVDYSDDCEHVDYSDDGLGETGTSL